LKEADLDGNGSLDVGEFGKFVEKIAFKKFDKDGSGSIDV
jgi:Ca2+-binding EF-hand superfamily protein